jgi:hypothetical protein
MLANLACALAAFVVLVALGAWLYRWLGSD